MSQTTVAMDQLTDSQKRLVAMIQASLEASEKRIIANLKPDWNNYGTTQSIVKPKQD